MIPTQELNNPLQLFYMQKLFVLVMAAIMMVADSSCLTTLQPVATVKTITKDDRLPGEWFDGKETYLIERLPDSKILRDDKDPDKKLSIGNNGDGDSVFFANSYAITTVKNGVEYIMTGTLSRINDQYFIDFMSLGMKDAKRGTDKGVVSSSILIICLPFSVAQLVFEGKDKIQLKFLNGDFIKEQIEKGNLRLKYEKDNLFGSFLVTASSL